MMIICPAIGDDHAAGPHRLVIPIHTILVRPRDRRKASSVKVVTGPEFVICALCDHWVKRIVHRCHCFCHTAE